MTKKKIANFSPFGALKKIFMAIMGVSFFFLGIILVIFMAIFMIGKSDPTEETYDIFDVCINYRAITDEFKGDGYEWVPDCREEIHEMREALGYKVDEDTSEEKVKLKTSMACAILYNYWSTQGKSFVPEEFTISWEEYSKTFTGNNFLKDIYNPDADNTWNKIKDYTGVDLKEGNRYKEIVSIAKVIYNYIKVEGGLVEQYMNWAKEIAEDPAHGYSQPNRHGPDYDCSSLVCYAVKSVGMEVPITSTYYMREIFTKIDGWIWIPKSQLGDISEYAVRTGRSSLIAGDILLAIQSHTEIYLGNNQNVGAHCDENGSIYGTSPGDQTGEEISITPYWDAGWNGVLRYVGK